MWVAMRIAIDLALDEQTIEALSTALDERDTTTMEHCKRVSKLACALGRYCSLSSKEMAALYTASVLHDVGKIGIPDSILFKPSILTDDEFSIIKTHPMRGERIIKELASPLSKRAAKIVRHHHEHFDGKGYPDKLSGEDIPFLSRILFVADCYDGVMQSRSYHEKRTHEEAMRILHSETGSTSDPSIFKVFASKIGEPDFANIFISFI